MSAPVARIAGQHSSVIQICANEDENQFITVTSDKRIRLYDIRTWSCIQTLLESEVIRIAMVCGASLFRTFIGRCTHRRTNSLPLLSISPTSS